MSPDPLLSWVGSRHKTTCNSNKKLYLKSATYNINIKYQLRMVKVALNLLFVTRKYARILQ